MQIGETIRKYRKMRDMTQEEMANRLGVTPPAVNKWENGNSFPDITMLAPIARLLDISLDTLLSFQSELTKDEIRDIVTDIDAKFKERPYEESFQAVKEYIEKYPNCDELIWQLAQILDAQRILKDVQDSDKYDGFITGCYLRALESKKENVRHCAADSLYNFYMRKERYDEAEKYLEYFSDENPERKRKHAVILSKTGRVEEAYKKYEELLMIYYQMVGMVFNGLYMLAVQEGNMERAHLYTEKQTALARLFEMGEYYEVSGGLDLAVLEQDAEKTADIVEKILSSVEKLSAFTKSPLYEHMTFKKIDDSFTDGLKRELINSFRDEESYGFMKDNRHWEEMLERYGGGDC